METADYLRRLRANWYIFVAATLAGLGVSAAFVAAEQPIYEASSTLFVSTSSAGNTAELQQGSTFARNRVATYESLVKTPITLEPVIDELGLNTGPQSLASRVTTSTPTDTSLITITVTDANAESAAAISNAIAKSLTSVVSAIETPVGVINSPVKITNVSEATAASRPVSPNIPQGLALGCILGLIAGAGIVGLRLILDNKIRSLGDLAHITQHPILGTVPNDPAIRRHPLAVHADPLGSAAEHIRTVRTNLRFVGVDGGKSSFMVTSSAPGEGKSTFVVNLALALIDAGHTVALIDADLRRPRVADLLNVEGGAGLSDVLVGRASITDVMLPWGQKSLYVLPAGKIPPNPSELLGSTRMRLLIEDLEKEFDYILIDSPPCLAVTDAAVLSQIVGGTIFVVSSGKTTKAEVVRALNSLATADSGISGLVMTMTKASESSYAYGYTQVEETFDRRGGTRKPRRHQSARKRRSEPGL